MKKEIEDKDDYICIYRGTIIRHVKDDEGIYVAEKSSDGLLLEIVKRKKVATIDLRYLGQKDGKGMDYYIEHHAISLLDLKNQKFIFVTGKNNERHYTTT